MTCPEAAAQQQLTGGGDGLGREDERGGWPSEHEWAKTLIGMFGGYGAAR
jgi:hypothetical protein